MAKDTSPFVVGEYWLDKRRDGKAGNVWQIARYSAESRSIIYRSTKRGDLEDAKGVLLAFVNQERAKGRQTAEERSEEHTSELQSLMRISYAVFCLKKKKLTYTTRNKRNISIYNNKTMTTSKKFERSHQNRNCVTKNAKWKRNKGSALDIITHYQ